MKLHIENRIRAGYIAVFFLLGLSYISFFIATMKLNEHTIAISHNNEVINKLESLISYVKDAETGVRGYIAVKDEQFLDVYNKSFGQLRPIFDALNKLLEDDKIQQSRLEILKTRINEKYKILREGIILFKSSGLQMTDTLRTMAYHGKEIMETIRSMVQVMEYSENSLLIERTANIHTVLKTLNIITITSIIIAIILGFYSMITYNRENQAKKLASANALSYRLQLEKRVKELDEANRELKALKSIEKFATSGRIARQMAHEIRNPLTNIGLASEQLRGEMGNTENEDHLVFFDMIDRNTKRINQLVSDLLNSTKFAQLQVQDIAINDLVDEVLEDADDRLELKSIKLEKNYENGMIMVSVDKERMKIAILNIIVNAIEAMESGKGVLKINTATINKKCCLKITDNGNGISKDALGKLFEPYFTGKSKGTGLGLTSTQNIILNHKGSIDVESEEGKGSTFIITLNFVENGTA